MGSDLQAEGPVSSDPVTVGSRPLDCIPVLGESGERADIVLRIPDPVLLELSPQGNVLLQEELCVPEVSKEEPRNGSFGAFRRGHWPEGLIPGMANGFFITHGSVASKSSVSLSVICSRPLLRAQELEQLHVETQSGEPWVPL